MRKDNHFPFKPYSFHGRLLLFLLLAALASCIISAAGSVLVNIVSVHEEVESSEHEVAVYLLGLQQKTSLGTEEMLAMTANNILETDILSRPEWTLNAMQLRAVQQGEVITLTSGFTSMPTTYMLLGNDIISIHPAHDFNLLLSVLPRIGSTLLLSLALFIGISAFVSYHISRPVTQMTQATALIRNGDFTVRLPEDKNGEIGELMRSFNSMTEELSRTAYLQKDFISSISHEFRTPIASIKGFARLLQMPGLDESSRREYVDMISQESDRLSRLSDTLLRLSALEQQTGPASLSSFRLDEQLRQVILQLEPTWAERGIDWQLSLDEVTVESDDELLMQVWINLIQNAIKFSPDNSVIEISVSQLDMAEVTITDHGIGMSEETISRLFDRFFQGDTSRSREGVGLGLCLVKRITDILGGTIRVKSAPGQGSTFRIRIPLRSTHSSKEAP